MTPARVTGGDIALETGRMGRRFYAVVIERHERELEAQPIDPRVTHHRVKAREVLGSCRESRAQDGRAVEAMRSVG